MNYSHCSYEKKKTLEIVDVEAGDGCIEKNEYESESGAT